MAQIEELKRQKEEAEKTAQQRLDEAQVRRQQTIAREEITTPHLTNLNEDPLLTGHLKYAFKPGRNSAGKKSDRFQPDIPVNGLGVEENHCAFLNEGGVVTIEPSRSDAAKVLVNGQPLKAAQQLKHEDRIRVGNNLLFLYVDPAVERNPEINWEFAQKEANGQEMQRLLGAKEEEMQRKMMEEKAQFQQQLEDYQRRIEEMRREKEMQGESSQKQIAEKEREMEDRQKTMMEKFKQKEGELKKLEQDIGYKKRVEDELSNAFKLTNDASARAAMLGKKPRFRPEFYKKPGPDGRVGKGYENTHVRMRVILPELDDSVKLYWSPDKMEAKLADMVDMTEQYTNGVPLNEIEVESDPFAVSEEDIEAFGGGGVLGQCNLLAQTLYHLLNIDERCPVYDSKGVEVGKVHVVVNPRLEELDIEEFDSMSELVGHRMTWEFRILEAEDLPLSCSKNVFCTYDLPWHSHDTFQTEKAQGRNPRFNYQKNHDFIVTEQNSKAVMDFSIVIIVNGEAPEEVRNAAIAKLRQVLGPDAHIGRRPQEEVKTASAKPALASSDQGKSAGNPQPLAPGASNPAEKRAAQPHDPAGKPVLRQSDFIDSVGKPADPPSASPRNQVKPEEHKTSPEFKSKPSPASLQPIPDTTVTVVPGSSAPVVPVGVAPKTSNKSGCCAVF